MATRAELLEAIGQRYRASAGAEKGQILDEFVAVTGYHRKHGIPDDTADARAILNRIETSADSDIASNQTPRVSGQCNRRGICSSPPPSRTVRHLQDSFVETIMGSRTKERFGPLAILANMIEVEMRIGRGVARWWTGIRRLGITYANTRTAHATIRRDAFDVRSLQLETRGASEALIRGACQTAYLHDRDAICRALGRYRMFVATDDIGLSSFLMLDGYWEMSITEALVELITPGMVVVDCGANLGYYTLLSADLVGPEGAVYGFEPNPDLARRVTASVSVNGYSDRVTLYQCALGESAGDIVLFVPPGEPKNGHSTDIAIADADPTRGHVIAPQRRLDEVLADQRVDLIKIDVEGSEHRLWDGMRSILDRNAPLKVLLEFAAVRCPDPAGLIDDIIARGFTTRIITAEEGILPISRDQILSARPDRDQMLLLER